MTPTERNLLATVVAAEGHWRIVDAEMLPEITALVRKCYVTSRQCAVRRHPQGHNITVWTHFQGRDKILKYAVYATPEGKEFIESEIDNQPTLF